MKCTIYFEDILDPKKPYLRDLKDSTRCSCCKKFADFHDRKPIYFVEIFPVVSSVESGDDDQKKKARRILSPQGMAIFSNGDVYTGQWKKNFMHGRGMMVFANGDRYKGEFVYGNRDGPGCMNFVNGDRYFGDWVDGKRSGYGECKYHDGRYYYGEWQNDSPSENLPTSSSSQMLEEK